MMKVAGPGALPVAKAPKIAERTQADDRVRDKDAIHVLRLRTATFCSTSPACYIDSCYVENGSVVGELI